MNEEKNPQLVYFPSRGNAQVIRMLMMEIQVQYDDVFIDQKNGIPAQLREKHNLSMCQIPYLIHDGYVIEEIFPIVKYLCLRFDRPDLLGKTVQDGIRIAEVLVKYSVEKNCCLKTLMCCLRDNFNKKLEPEDVMKIRSQIKQILISNKYYQASVKMFRKTNGYLLGYLTVLDFVFYDKAFLLFYLSELEASPLLAYKQFFESTEFYQKHHPNINSYPIFNFEAFPQHVVQMLQKILK